MGARGGGGGRGGGGRSASVLYGAAARNELRKMNESNFFQHGFTNDEYKKYVNDENARRGNPVVVGNAGVEVGHMVHIAQEVPAYNPKTGKYDQTKVTRTSGVVASFEGDMVKIIEQGGHPQYFKKSSITHYAKNKNIGFGSFRLRFTGKKVITI